MSHLKASWGTTATIATLVIVGAFVILYRVADKVDTTTLVALVGGWVSSIVTGFVVLKSAQNKPKDNNE